ncbi:MAG: isoleucine--tRNA ligase [Deltaproteobacteria bacterium]|nr:isoleucine--tRNA ligase [Deltaproteobacteria bacterium]
MADYKASLNLPQTDFPMKADLGRREPDFLKFWEENKIYSALVRKNQQGAPFIFHDGPPYANGHIHYGTILNKVLKDMVVKYKNMNGRFCEFIPGWDCHGLPIELQVDKELGPKKNKMTVLEFRKACREYAEKFIDIQRNEFKRLGCFGDWENPYLTMSPHYESVIAREFGRFVKAGFVYRGKKPVFWCASCRTVLAEAEIEYKDRTAPSIYVKFRMVEEARLRQKWSLPDSPVYAVIWTTTPWTLPANLGIALHPELTYAAVKIEKEIWIVADGLLNKILEIFGSPECDVLAKFSARDLENLHARHPFLPKESLIILGPHVTLEAGTGCVHTAPGHGYEDYEVGKKYGLEPFAPVDEKGCFTKEAGLDWLTGQFVEKANRPIIEHLKQAGALIKEETIQHSYPHCSRCGKGIVFRATDQWFVSMENRDLRKKALRAIDQVAWIPAWGRNRIYGMVQARPDWCVSRQRQWGVPIIAAVCEVCAEAATSAELVEKAAKLFEKEGGSDLWFSLDLEKILPKDFQCPHCKKKTKFKKETAILDVWFDSGVSYAAVLEDRNPKNVPADLYLEGSDQHRGWFHTSLLTAVATRDQAPYKTVLTHGFVVDQEGKKLSKSAQNYVPPENVLKAQGAELLRMWVANEDYFNDIRFSGEILTHLVDAYRKIRNTCRYLLGNLADFAPETERTAYEKMPELDRWALFVLHQLVDKVRQAYENYEFHKIAHAVNRFCAVECSALYFDIIKDRLYCEAKGGELRKSAQTVLFEILNALVRLIAPILSFTAEEVWQAFPPFKARNASVFLAGLPQTDPQWNDAGLGERWERLLTMREAVTKALEVARAEKVIRNSLEARLVLEASKDQEEFLKSFQGLADIFIVSAVTFGRATGDWVHTSEAVAGLKVGVAKAEGQKCVRCWKYLPSVGKNKVHPEICLRCISVVTGSTVHGPRTTDYGPRTTDQ